MVQIRSERPSEKLPAQEGKKSESSSSDWFFGKVDVLKNNLEEGLKYCSDKIKILGDNISEFLKKNRSEKKGASIEEDFPIKWQKEIESLFAGFKKTHPVAVSVCFLATNQFPQFIEQVKKAHSLKKDATIKVHDQEKIYQISLRGEGENEELFIISPQSSLEVTIGKDGIIEKSAENPEGKNVRFLGMHREMIAFIPTLSEKK